MAKNLHCVLRLPFTSPFTTYCSSPRNERERKGECKHKSFCSVNGLDNLRYCLTSPKRAQFLLQFWKARIAVLQLHNPRLLSLIETTDFGKNSPSDRWKRTVAGFWRCTFLPAKNRGKQEPFFFSVREFEWDNKFDDSKIRTTHISLQDIARNASKWKKVPGKKREECLPMEGLKSAERKVRYSAREFEWVGKCSRIKSRTTSKNEMARQETKMAKSEKGCPRK